MNILKDLNTKRKITVALSVVWSALSFIISVLISNESSDSGVLVFLSILIIAASPVWLYWIGVWIWGSGYIVRFLKFITIQPLRKTVNALSRMAGSIPLYQVESNNKIGFIKRLFRGDVSLVITYWFFAFFILNVVFNVAFELVEYNYVKIYSSVIGKWLSYGFDAFILLYNIFILVALWRSAEKYRGGKKWISVVRFIVVISVIKLGSSFIGGFIDGYKEDEAAFKNELMSINKSLPEMVDKETRLDNILVQDRNIYYSYTLINHLIENLDISRLELTMTPQIKTSACITKETRVLLDDSRSLIYTYYAKI
jgi:hypothetical protein